MKKNEKTNQINKKSKTEQTNMSHHMVNSEAGSCQKLKFLISTLTFLLTKQTC